MLGIFLGFVGVIFKVRWALIWSCLTQRAFFQAYLNLLVMSAMAAMDGARSVTATSGFAYTPYTGYALAIAVANAVICGFMVLIMCFSATLTWLHLEAFQDSEHRNEQVPMLPSVFPPYLARATSFDFFPPAPMY